ncbi:helix-turn-helix domain-containing protein [Streptomyces genisteinicus]|uniref:Helix-turn-helix domain-containing protein n=1 Tax=Streptomyces genisteinicus TaxID=2768068 RepID=A0A7H0HPR3_9ACTN|nr:helix-turn-helix transcriptional regulator [Streptomyces genisteinicus]QNP62529.1 helix-turn-helix domain-containing protein [Streptomyces genisteinicus]
MAARKDIDGSAGVPALYGAELRFQREAAGLTLQQTVEGSFYGVSLLSEIERGTRRMPADLARHVDRLLGTDGFFERRCEDVRRARRGAHAGYFAQVAEVEPRARSIERWSPALVPGLLQTEAYTRAVIHATHPMDQPDEVEAKVAARVRRAAILDNPRTPEYWVVLHESLVLQPFLSRQDMAAQLARIRELAARRRIVLQVLLWNAPTRPFLKTDMMFMQFADAPPLLYTEGAYHGQLIDDPALVEQYHKAYDRLRAAALSPEASLAMIDAAAEDYRNGKQPD